MRVLLDTGILIGLMVENDQYHQRAVNELERLKTVGARFFVSDYVMDEFLTRVLYDAGAKTAQIARDNIQEMLDIRSLFIFPIGPDIFDQTLQDYDKYLNKGLSFTDATTIIAYQKGGFDLLLTYDSHFRKVGTKVSLL